MEKPQTTFSQRLHLLLFLKINLNKKEGKGQRVPKEISLSTKQNEGK